jgi:hypothetical protein
MNILILKYEGPKFVPNKWGRYKFSRLTTDDLRLTIYGVKHEIWSDELPH